jgi:outer membrane protein TolC
MASPSTSVINSMSQELKLSSCDSLKKIVGDCAEKEGIARSNTDLVVHMVNAILEYFIIEAAKTGSAKIPDALPARLARMIVHGMCATKAVILTLLISVGAASYAAAGALDLTLDGAVQTALKNNATVVTAEETRRIYQEKITEYWGTVYPQLSATGKYTRNFESPLIFIGGSKIKSGLKNAYSGSLDLEQVLWAGGKVRTGIRMAGMYAADSDEQLKTASNDISKAVKQMYYQVLLSSSLAVIQRESLNLAVQHLATIEAQYKQGLASDLAVLRQEVEVSNTEPALTQALNLYEEGLIELKNLLGLDPETEINLADELACTKSSYREITELYKTALLNRPEFRDAKLKRDLYLEMIKIEQAAHYPYLSAFASRQFQGQSDSGFPGAADQSWATTAGLSLSLPLFSGGSTSSKVRQARIQADIAETDLRELERTIKIAVKKAWLSFQEASMRLESQATSVQTARKALDATEVRFKNGLASQLELNDTSLALNKSQTLFTQAQHDTCSADAELKWTLGE